MIQLSRRSPRGRKRSKPRIEHDLIKISVQGIVTNKGGTHTVNDRKNGKLLQFVDEIVDGQYRLVVYQNSLPILAYQLAEKPIGGCIKSHRNWWADCQYYVVVNGRRYSHLYVDTKNKKIGTRHCHGALYTSESISPAQADLWREYREIQKKAARLEC